MKRPLETKDVHVDGCSPRRHLGACHKVPRTNESELAARTTKETDDMKAPFVVLLHHNGQGHERTGLCAVQTQRRRALGPRLKVARTQRREGSSRAAVRASRKAAVGKDDFNSWPLAKRRCVVIRVTSAFRLRSCVHKVTHLGWRSGPQSR
jgi:hypothetical protein